MWIFVNVFKWKYRKYRNLKYLLFSNNNKRNIIENFKKSQIKRGFVSSVNSTVGGGKSNIVTIVNNFNFGKDNNFKILNIKSK